MIADEPAKATSDAVFKDTLWSTTALLQDFVSSATRGDGAVVDLAAPPVVAQELQLSRRVRDGLDAGDFTDFLRAYLDRSIRLHHPGSLAHQVAVPHLPAALADLVHGAINNPMAIYEMGPAATTLELAVVNILLEAVGWRPQPLDAPGLASCGGGVLTHGGSLANLTALLAARAAAAPEAWDEGTPHDLVILAPAGGHYSVARAVSILGLGRRAIRHLPVDDLEVLRPDGVAAALDAIAAEGLRCMAVVANACSTSTGLYDPIGEIGGICRARGVWLHVDAAHGASALLAPSERHLLDGIEQADSVTWDAHKMLRTSGLCTAVLFRDVRTLDSAFAQEAAYLLYPHEQGGPDLLPRALECTKTGLGLKWFLALVWGEPGAAGRYVAQRYQAARRFHDLIVATPGFTSPFRPQANIVCFRYGDNDDLQVAIRDALLAEGSYHLSSTTVTGTRYLRMVVTPPATEEAHVRALLSRIRSVADRLVSGAPSAQTGTS